MKNFTKLFVSFALLCFAGVLNVNAQDRIYATFSSPSNTNAQWNADSQSFSWTQGWYNQIHNVGLLEYENVNGQFNDISEYKKLVIDYEIIDGEQFRILFYQGGSNIAIYISAAVATVGEKEKMKSYSAKVSSYENSSVIEIPIFEALTADNIYSSDFILKCSEICLSGQGGSGEVKINEMYLETYGPGDEIPIINPEEEEQQPDKPEGYVDLTTDMFPNPIVNMETKIGNGTIVFGQKSQDSYADLTGYSELLVVGTPGLKVVFNLNHNVNIKENLSDYEEDDPSDYVWIDALLDENGMYSLDLTQYEYAYLNNIRLPWDNNNKGYVWYLLLKEGGDGPVVPQKPEKPEGYVDLTQDMFYQWDGPEADASVLSTDEEGNPVPVPCDLVLDTPQASGMIYGNSMVLYDYYADLSNYSELLFVATPGMTIRCLFNREYPIEGGDEHGNDFAEIIEEVGEDGLLTIDLTSLELRNTSGVMDFAHLNSVKVAGGSKMGRVYYILLKEKDGSATAIKGIAAAKADGVIFDLQGRRVSQATKGVYILNGKKVIR
jgi:hypothetical protein